MLNSGYEGAPALVREIVADYMLERIEQLDATAAAAIDTALTATQGPMLRARCAPSRGNHHRPDHRMMIIDVMLPDFEDATWRTWFTIRLRGRGVRELFRMLTWQAPDDPGELIGDADPGVQ